MLTNRSVCRHPAGACRLISSMVFFMFATTMSVAQIQNDAIGFTPNHVFDGTLKGETVDVMTGNLNLRFPIGPRYQLSSDFGYQIQAYYNSKLWENNCSPITLQCPGTLQATDTYGLGFNIHFGRVYQHPDDRSDVYRFQSADGGEHFFCYPYDPETCSMSGLVHDASMITASKSGNTWTIAPGDGTRLLLNHQVTQTGEEALADSGWYVTRIETIAQDSSENPQPQHHVDITYGFGNAIDYIEDSAGRTIDFDYSGGSLWITFPAFEGSDSSDPLTTASYELVFSGLTPVQDPWPQGGTQSRGFLREIRLPTLPDNPHVFTYGSSRGYLTDWQLPTGASVHYDYKHYSAGPKKLYVSEMVMKTLTSEGQQYRWSYTRFGDGLLRTTEDLLAYHDGLSYNATNANKVKVLDPFDNLTVYRFYHTVFGLNEEYTCFGDSNDGLLYEVLRYAGPSEDGSRLADQEVMHYATDDPLEFEYRNWPVSCKLPVSVRLDSQERIKPGSGQLPATRVKQVFSDWLINFGNVANRSFAWPRIAKEYINDELYRTTETDYTGNSVQHYVHNFVKVTDKAGDVVSYTDRHFTNVGRLECEVKRSAGQGVGSSGLDCQNLQLIAGDVATINEFDPDTGNTMSLTLLGGDDLLSQAIDFDYSETSGLLKTSQYRGLGWLARDRDMDFNSGLPFESRGADGIRTLYSWDSLGRLAMIDPQTPEDHTEITYVDLSETQVQKGTTQSIYHYDDLGRLIREETKNLDEDFDYRLTEYDISGRVLRSSEWASEDTFYDDLTWTTMEYKFGNTEYTDPLGRVSRVTGPDGEVVETEYEGRSQTVRQYGIGGTSGDITAETVYLFDELDRLVEVDAPGSGADAVYDYDERDNLIEVQLNSPAEPTQLQVRSFGYDGLGRLRHATHPESGTTEYVAYDARGNLLEYVDSKLNRFTRGYDEAGRLTAEKLEIGGAEHTLVENIYDESTYSTTSAGKLTTARSYSWDGTSAQLAYERRYIYGDSTVSCWNDLEGSNLEGFGGRLARTRTRILPWDEDVETSYCYNQLGVLSGIDYPNITDSLRLEAEVGYIFHNGFLWEVHDASPDRNYQHVESVKYGPGGSVLEMVRGNGMVDQTPRDARGRPMEMNVLLPDEGTDPDPLDEIPGCQGGQGLENLQYCGPSGGGSYTTLWTTGQYQYDGAGNITAIGADSYYYDDLNRLDYANIYSGPGYNLDYEYDAFGNMTRRTKAVVGGATDVRDYAVDWQTNRLATQTHGQETYAYGYDQAGNMISAGDRGYGFDVRNRLVRATDNEEGELAQYAYDGGGNRILALVDGVETFYFRDETGRVLSEYGREAGSTDEPDWDKDYVYVLGNAIALVKNDDPGKVQMPWTENVSQLGVTLHWSAVEEPDINQYLVLEKYWARPDSDLVIATFPVLPDSGSSTLTFSRFYPPGFVKPATRVEYQVKAVDTAANSGEWSNAVVVHPSGDESQTPPAPTNLIAEPTDRAIRLWWTPVDDEDLWGYLVELETVPGQWTTLTPMPLTAVGFWHTGLVNGEMYAYRVRAIDTSERVSDPSNISSATPLDNLPPVRPMGVEARPGRAAEVIELNWEPVQVQDLASYRIFRAANGGALSQVSEVPGVVASFVDTDSNGVTEGNDYCYSIQSVDTTGNASLDSDLVCTRPRYSLASPPEVETADFEVDDRGTVGTGCDYWSEDDDIIQVRVTWSAASSDDGYRVYRADGSSEEFLPVGDDVSAGTTEFVDTEVNGDFYRYYVVALDDSMGESETHADGTVTDDTAAGDDLGPLPSVRASRAWNGATQNFGTFNEASRAVTLRWARVPDPRVIGYHVYRKSDLSGCEPDSVGQNSVRQVQQLDLWADSWVRLTTELATAERIYEDRTTGGLQGCFIYAVRPVTVDGEEGGIDWALNVDVEINGAETHCYEDTIVHDTDNFLSANVPMQEELDRVNAIARGSGSSTGSPSPPSFLKQSIKDMPKGNPNVWWCFDPVEWFDTECQGYVEGMRETRFMLLEWGYDAPEVPPSDLAGYHIEVAGSYYGPWRRVTERMVSWWETSYRYFGVGIKKGDPQPMLVPPSNPVAEYFPNDQYSGHMDCMHFRVIAVDEDGNEAAPLYVTEPFYRNYDEIVSYPLPNCPATPEAPTNLQASTYSSGTGCGGCSTKLTWDKVEGATEYIIYRHILPGGMFFYPTNVQAATPDAVQEYIETGDEEGSQAPDNQDCPTAPGWNYGLIVVPTWCGPCKTGSLEAYYVTARYEDGGESPRSEIVLWDCTEDPGYPPIVFDRESPSVWLAEAFLAESHQVLPATMAVPAAWHDELPVCDVGDNPNLATEAAAGPAIAPYLTLASGANPPFRVYDLHVDHLGSTRVVTDEAGSIVSQHDFFPFGEEIMPMLDFSTKMFTGHERDRETGLDYMFARYYRATLTRFLTTDPVNGTARSPQSWNRYAYVRDDPLNATDPTGQFRVFVGWGDKAAADAARLEQAMWRFYLGNRTTLEEFYGYFGVKPKKIEKWFTPDKGPRVKLKADMTYAGWALPLLAIRIDASQTLKQQIGTLIHELTHKVQYRKFRTAPSEPMRVTPEALNAARIETRGHPHPSRREFIAYLFEMMIVGGIY